MNSPPNFSRLAALYHWMEFFTFGTCLARTRFAYLGQLRSCRHALVLGDGDGRFTARLLRANPTLQIDAVDASPAMLQALLRRADPHAARIRIHLADARNWQPTAPSPRNGNFDSETRSVATGLDSETWDAKPDLIVTHFFLDCLTTAEVQSLASRLRAAASPSALWIVSEFFIPPGWFGRLVAQPLVAALYRAFALLTGLAVRSLPDHPSALRQAGFTLQTSHPKLAGLLISELWSASPATPPQTPTSAPS